MSALRPGVARRTDDAARWVAGVDGCRGGWFVVLCSFAPGKAAPARISSLLCRNFAAVLALPEQPAAIAVDMPIGLLDRHVPGGRTCDREARMLLGRPHGSSVFTPPTRPGLAARRYGDVPVLNGAGMSKQSFNILPRIREVDDALQVADQSRVFETHPELVFARLAGGPLAHNKKTPAGRHERMRLLRRAYGSARIDVVGMRLRGGLSHVALDDVVDACALAHAARCILEGDGCRVPAGEPPRDARGLRMETWY